MLPAVPRIGALSRIDANESRKTGPILLAGTVELPFTRRAPTMFLKSVLCPRVAAKSSESYND